MARHFGELLASREWLMPLSSEWLRPLTKGGHGVTGQRPAHGAHLPCRGCRGRGWKRVSARTTLALSTVNDRARAASKRRCLDCDGSGKE